MDQVSREKHVHFEKNPPKRNRSLQPNKKSTPELRLRKKLNRVPSRMSEMSKLSRLPSQTSKITSNTEKETESQSKQRSKETVPRSKQRSKEQEYLVDRRKKDLVDAIIRTLNHTGKIQLPSKEERSAFIELKKALGEITIRIDEKTIVNKREYEEATCMDTCEQDSSDESDSSMDEEDTEYEEKRKDLLAEAARRKDYMKSLLSQRKYYQKRLLVDQNKTTCGLVSKRGGDTKLKNDNKTKRKTERAKQKIAPKKCKRPMKDLARGSRLDLTSIQRKVKTTEAQSNLLNYDRLLFEELTQIEPLRFDLLNQTEIQRKLLKQQITMAEFTEQLQAYFKHEREFCESIQKKIFLKTNFEEVFHAEMRELRSNGRKKLRALAKEFHINPLKITPLKTKKKRKLGEEKTREEKVETKAEQVQTTKKHDICHKITKDFILIGTELAEYNVGEIPELVMRQWKGAFVVDKCHLNATEKMTSEHTKEQLSAEEKLSLDKQYIDLQPKGKVFPEAKFNKWNMTKPSSEAVENYLNYEIEWIADHRMIPLQEELGFIVTKVLRHINPVPMPPTRPVLPPFSGAFCMHGLPKQFYPLFKKILHHYRILFLTPDELIDHCVREYRKLHPKVLSPSPNHEKSNPFTIEEEEEVAELPSAAIVSTPIIMVGKRTQTPAVFPVAELTPDAESVPLISPVCGIGEKMVARLAQGETIDAKLTVEALVYFLTSASDYKGWVLANFPQNMDDVTEMESTLLGRFLPMQEKENARNEMVVISGLAPYIINARAPFVAYMSHCISISTNKRFSVDVRLVQKFYQRYSRFVEFKCYQQTLTKEVVMDIFNFILENTEKETTLGVSKSDPIGVPDLKDLDVFEETEVDMMSDKSMSVISFWNENIVEEEAQRVKEEDSEDLEQKWFLRHYHFVEFDAPQRFLSAMGREWQSMESEYLKHLNTAFEHESEFYCRAMSYKVNVNTLITDLLEMPNEKKQILVDEFQSELNSLADEMRGCKHVKNLLCEKAFILQHRLWKICDEVQYVEREAVARRIASLNWLFTQLTSLTNVSFTLMKAELTRFAQTMRLLSDYYLLAVKKYSVLDDCNRRKDEILSCEFQIEEEMGNILSPVDFIREKGFRVNIAFVYKRLNIAFHQYKKLILCTNVHYSELPENLRQQLVLAITNEKRRVLLRTELIKRNIFHDLLDFEVWYRSLVDEQFDLMMDRYEREIEAVNRLCLVLSEAIEQETGLSQRVLLKGDDFCIVSESTLNC